MDTRLEISLSQGNEWQVIDTELGILFPWYTNNFLEVLRTWDISSKTVWEYGMGSSTLWYQRRCKMVYAVDDNLSWVDAVARTLHGCDNVELHHHSDMEGLTRSIFIPRCKFDIVVIDGEHWRDECIDPALECLTPGGILICDNWQQQEVWVSDYADRKLSGYEHYIFKQDGHPHWQTAYFKI